MILTGILGGWFYLNDAEDLSWTGLLMFVVGGGVTISGILTLQMRGTDSHVEHGASKGYGRCRKGDDDEGAFGSVDSGVVIDNRHMGVL